MKRILIAVAGAGVIGLVVFAGLAAGSSTGKASVKIHVVELFTHAGSVDVAPSGPSQGDYLVWDDALVKPGTKQIVGHVTGTCFLVNVAGGLYDCPGATFALPDGQIVDQGLLALAAKSSYGVMIGGTGAYAGMHGESKGTAAGANALDWVLTLTR